MNHPLAKDYIVIGSGPNGLAAAITLAQTGRSVLLLEGEETIGGGARSGELTLPGFTHDLCSAVHPLAVASPFFQTLPLEKFGLKWIKPPIPLAHPMEDGSVACLHQSIEETAKTLAEDGEAYQKWMEPFYSHWKELIPELLQPVHFPRHPILMARFGLDALRSATSLCHHLFEDRWAKGLFGGLAAHSFLPLTQSPSSAVGMMLALAGHAVGWPIPEGGSQKISDALLNYFKELGGEIETGHLIRSSQDIPPAKQVLFDLNPHQLLKIAGEKFSESYQRKLGKLRLGPGVFKLDWALSGPIPWKAPECEKASTVHLGGTLENLVESEQALWQGKVHPKPFVLLSQPTPFDPTRAPDGKHIAWAYIHVPRGSTEDYTELIEEQVERYAPGFRDLILAKKKTFPKDLEQHNPNLIGGDISGGIPDLWQILFRPTWTLSPYQLPVKNWYLCSSSTPPGSGVHGMCGFYAAKKAVSCE
jgi:phytoene dehydrogenase-like protein